MSASLCRPWRPPCLPLAPRPPSTALRRAAPCVLLAVPALVVCKKARRCGAAVVAAAMDDASSGDGFLSGEWPENLSLLSDTDLYAYLATQIVTSDTIGPTARLMDVMSRPAQVATVGQRLAELDAVFAAHYSGLPVVDDESRCIGVVSSKDKARATNGVESTVGEVMSSHPVTLTYDKTVLEAAALMLRENVHRIPVVNEQQQVIGIVTRTDVFQTLETNKA